ncbi:hypothetical protein Sjap_009189 [Stephania japonica]|uniref:Uncharacterized protein n=1 Tax=Stephania japonica TaxID=461633 RepID=A0AAP0PFB4_9MAGN
MAALRPPCPPNSFLFNASLCACNPGFVLNSTSKACDLFQSSSKDWLIDSGVDYSISFPVNFFSFDSIKRFTQSQAVFLEATLVMVAAWLLFCAFVRVPKVRNGESVWFRIRWWISRLDLSFATHHWLEDQKVVKKRKTELGGTFCMASWILFIGLSAALIYRFISGRSVEIHNVRAANAPDLLTFINDMEFNITTISSMSCSHVRELGTLVEGNPASVDYRVIPLSTFVNYSCYNTSQGPTINFGCSNCRVVGDDMYLTWQFVDLPNDPAVAVGFQFTLTANKHHDRKHVSLVSGTLKNGSYMDDRPITFRGRGSNVLKFHLFPRIYHNVHDLRIIQPLFHEFRPGSFFLDKLQLQNSLQSSRDGLINMTLFIRFLSDYIIEVDNKNVLGLGFYWQRYNEGLGLSLALNSVESASVIWVGEKHGWTNLLYSLLSCVLNRIKRLRNEDTILRSIRNRTKAQLHWDKLRKYVTYTWGARLLDDNEKTNGEGPLCNCIGVESGREKSLDKRKQNNMPYSISLNKKASFPAATPTNASLKTFEKEAVKSFSGDAVSKSQSHHQESEEQVLGGEEVGGSRITHGTINSTESCKSEGSQSQLSLPTDTMLPLPPNLEVDASGSNIADIHKSLQDLYEYNAMLREKLLAAQSMLKSIAERPQKIDVGALEAPCDIIPNKTKSSIVDANALLVCCCMMSAVNSINGCFAMVPVAIELIPVVPYM